MAGKSKTKKEDVSSKRKKLKDWSNVQYVLNNLDERHWEWMDSLTFDHERYAEFIEACVEQGFSIKVDWDNYSECMQVTATCMWENYHNTGYAVSGRSEDVWDAFNILWFKLAMVAEFDLVAQADERPKRGKRG